jgi:UPF0716 protein FxsA
MKYLPLLFGVAEIVLFVAVASWIGVGWTILLALLTSVVGFLILRREGLKAWSSLRESVAAGSAVDQEAVRRRMSGTGSRLMAAFLLILPGFLTDAFGALLLIPAVRTGIGQRMAFSAMRTFPAGGAAAAGGGAAGFGGMGAGVPGTGTPGQGGPDWDSPGYRSSDSSHVVIEGEIVDSRDDDPDGT